MLNSLKVGSVKLSNVAKQNDNIFNPLKVEKARIDGSNGTIEHLMKTAYRNNQENVVR